MTMRVFSDIQCHRNSPHIGHVSFLKLHQHVTEMYLRVPISHCGRFLCICLLFRNMEENTVHIKSR